MKRFILPIIFVLNGLYLPAQAPNYDSLKEILVSSRDDSSKLSALNDLFNAYLFSNPDSALIYLKQSLTIARQKNSDKLLAAEYLNLGWFHYLTGDYPNALHSFQESLRLATQNKDQYAVAAAYDMLASVYTDLGDFQNALSNEKKAFATNQLIPANPSEIYFIANRKISISSWTILYGFASLYDSMNALDSAQKYNQLVDSLALISQNKKWAPVYNTYGSIQTKRGDYQKALQNYRTAIYQSKAEGNIKDLMDGYNGIAKTFIKTGLVDSGIYYANKVLDAGRVTHYSIAQVDALNLLANIYKSTGNIDSVVKYLQLSISAKDSLFSRQKVMQVQNMTFEEELHTLENQRQEAELRNKIKLYAILATLIIFLIISFLLYRNNRNKQKAFTLLQKQKQEIDLQKGIVEQTLNELKSTQSQLIQSEKMASLGELTAGIAHEIQNPLNFINNFSEVNKELLGELKEEIQKGNLGEANTLADDVMGNEEKISHHGKRADAIVKGMLQHSRESKGQKEPVDFNALADEYLRLAYHGLRSKDNSFNATMITDFDKSIGNINIIPQDMGRVLLNLYNNAFYAVAEKARKSGGDYKPAISVESRLILPPGGQRGAFLEIKVEDNGPGIPQRILDKIFQPFFTTKPTGQGTGLGLSLSYDIIKAHGGEIKVNSKEGEGTEFIIQLPVV